MEVRIATAEEITRWWDEKIKKHPKNNSYKVWKESFVQGNLSQERTTFFVFDNKKYIGQGTLLLKSKDRLMTGRGKAEIIKLEVEPEWQGKGISTKIYNAIEAYAKQMGIDTLTIGVEPCEIKNMQIYFHWGFTTFIKVVTETFPPKDPNGKGEVITVLCYKKSIK